MSNTRRSMPGETFSQERFASAAALEEGLLANLVARRCKALEHDADRDLVFFLQYLSWQKGGLGAVVRELVRRYPEEFASPSMRAIGVESDRIYTAEQVKAVRLEAIGLDEESFLLRGESSTLEAITADHNRRVVQQRESKLRPNSYPAKNFVTSFREAAEAGLETLLVESCLNPGVSILNPKIDGSQWWQLKDGAPWYCPRLLNVLRRFKADKENEAAVAFVETEVTRQVFTALDYAATQGGILLIEGKERIGKSHAVQNWCRRHPGTARYVQVPSTNDEMTFFRRIAESLGVSSSLSLKGVQLRERVEKTLQSAKLMLCFDEGHYLWPQYNRREALPGRINWIMTALEGSKVPVAICATPQFTLNRLAVEKTGWRSGQFVGRLVDIIRLPESISREELLAVARHHLPEADDKSLSCVRDMAMASTRYIACIEQIARRASFEAQKHGRKRVLASDIAQVIKSSILPAESELNLLVGGEVSHGRTRDAKRGVRPESLPRQFSQVAGNPRSHTREPGVELVSMD